MSPEQCRSARAWLGWSQQELAKRADVSLSTVHEYEIGRRTPTPNNASALQRAIESGGIRLLFDDAGVAAGIARRDVRIAD